MLLLRARVELLRRYSGQQCCELLSGKSPVRSAGAIKRAALSCGYLFSAAEFPQSRQYTAEYITQKDVHFSCAFFFRFL